MFFTLPDNACLPSIATGNAPYCVSAFAAVRP